jgi:hypothetical protein
MDPGFGDEPSAVVVQAFQLEANRQFGEVGWVKCQELLCCGEGGCPQSSCQNFLQTEYQLLVALLFILGAVPQVKGLQA